MAKEKAKILLEIDFDFLKEIDDYRYENRIPSRVEAVRQLIRKGLESDKPVEPTSKTK